MPFSVVISQGQSANPVKRKLEEDLVGALLFERGLEVTVIPHLYDLKADGTGMLCLQGITGDMILLSWLYPRAAFWTLDRNGIRGRMGESLLVREGDEEDEDTDSESDETTNGKPRVIDTRPLPNRAIYCIDLRATDDLQRIVGEVKRIVAEASMKTVGLSQLSVVSSPLQGASNPSPTLNGSIIDISGPIKLPPSLDPSVSPSSTSPTPESRLLTPAALAPTAEQPSRRWYPVIDYSRCTNCMECIDFCLFGVYGVDGAETILVEQPDNCRKGCPACSRVCPENAIIFPQHKTPTIAGSPNGEAGGLKIDLSKLFGAPDALQVAVLERDVELAAVGRDTVGMSVGIPKRRDEKSDRPKDELDALIDELDSFDL
jgi:NAD-dependent dihydropyrimidine dehydrogenase PreA subunit